MIATAWIAAYAAVISTILASINVFNFIKDRQILFANEQHLYFNDSSIYTIFLSNRSSKTLTIVDCGFYCMAVSEDGKLKPFCGHTPYHNASLADAREDKPFLELPIILKSGEVLIISLESEQITSAMNFIMSGEAEFDHKWRRTDIIELKLYHSFSRKPFICRFRTRHNEHSPMVKGVK